MDVIDTSIALGNRQQFGSWEAYPTNDTTIAEYLPTREYERPVIVVTPTSAINSTGGAVSDYSTSIKISSTVLQNQAFADQSLSGRYNAFSGTGFDGYFLPQASISSSRPYTVNSDVAVDRNLVYGIPLAIDRYSIYNISHPRWSIFQGVPLIWLHRFSREIQRRICGLNTEYEEISPSSGCFCLRVLSAARVESIMNKSF